MKNRAKTSQNCGSTNIKWINPQMWSLWICGDCEYQGLVIIEDEKARKNKKNMNNDLKQLMNKKGGNNPFNPRI